MKRTPTRWFMVPLLCGVLALLALTACTTPPRGHGAQSDRIRFRDWWNFYERGTRRIRQGDHAGGREDMETCLGLRRGARFGYPRESWFLMTYGMHWIEGYFPHRELGVCLYYLDELEAAQRYLERSLELEPSGRAKHFLNRVRGELAKRDEADGAAAPLAGGSRPRCSIELSADSEVRWTRDRHRVLAGKVCSRGYVSELVIGEQRPFIELAQQVFPFNEEMPLRPGTNRIVVAARDLLGGCGAREVVWVADWQPPELAVLSFDRTDAWLRVDVRCSDDHGLGALTVNGQPFFSGADAGARRDASIRISLSRTGYAVVEARDLAGNVRRTVLRGDDLLAARRLSRAFTVAALGETRIGADGAAGDSRDTLKPEVRLSEGLSTVSCFDPDYFLDGRASDGSGLASLTINGEERLPAQNRGALVFHFGWSLSLDPGTNLFHIVARDTQGNVRETDLCVLRREPEYVQRRFRLHVAVSPVRAIGCDPAEAALLRQLIKKAVNRGGARFGLCSRDEETWQRVYTEQVLNGSRLVDHRALAELQNTITPIDYLVEGTFRDHGDGTSVRVEVVDIEAADCPVTTDVYIDAPPAKLDAHLDLVEERIAGLVSKIERRFPIVKARVVDVGREGVLINVGRNDGVEEWSRFLVVEAWQEDGRVREGSVLCARDGRAVALRPDRLYAARTDTEVLPEGAGKAVKVGYCAYSR